MQVEYINPFLTSLVNAFRTMLNCEVHRGDLSLKQSLRPAHEVSGIIGLSGNAVGTVVLSVSKQVALQATSVMLMVEADDIDDDVVDAIGELANMVAGAAKAQLEEFNLSVSLPSVITGLGHEVRFPSNVTPVCVPYTCEWGELALEVGFATVAEPAGA